MKAATIHGATLTARIEGYKTLRAFARLHKLGDQPPYFSLTGEIENPRLRSDKIECCGQIHDELLKQWPNLKPIADLHLSDENGAPMHDVANGWYWAGGDREWCKGQSNDPPNIGHLSNHLRISMADATEIVNRVQAGEMNKEEFRAFVDAQRARWKAEAEAGIALIKQLAA